MITAVYCSVLALWLVILSVRVVALRGNPIFAVFAFWNEGRSTLDRAIRAHANFAEYAPMMLIMMGLAEMYGLASLFLHLWGGMFTAGRIAHGICFGFMRQNMMLRILGTALTLTPLAGLAIQLLILSLSAQS